MSSPSPSSSSMYIIWKVCRLMNKTSRNQTLTQPQESSGKQSGKDSVLCFYDQCVNAVAGYVKKGYCKVPAIEHTPNQIKLHRNCL